MKEFKVPPSKVKGVATYAEMDKISKFYMKHLASYTKSLCGKSLKFEHMKVVVPVVNFTQSHA